MKIFVNGVNTITKSVFSALSTAWQSKRSRGLIVFSFFLLMLPVIVISALTVTKYRQNASGEDSFMLPSDDGNWNLTINITPKSESKILVGQQILINGSLSLTAQGVSNAAGNYPEKIISCNLFTYDSGGNLSGGNNSFSFSDSSTKDKALNFSGYLIISSQDYVTYDADLSKLDILGEASDLHKFAVWCKAQSIPFETTTPMSITFSGQDSSFLGAYTAIPSESSCPLPGDARTYVSGNHCDSSTGLGYNTASGGYTCGPVACPGVKSSLPHGNTCIYSEVKDGKSVCFAGYGDTRDVGGFNPSGCHYNSSDNGQSITCPSSMKFTVHVNGITNNAPVTVAVDDNNRTHNYQTDAAGNITIQSFSGDKVVLTPQTSTSYTSIFPSTVTTTVNTTWGCGTNGVSNPCTFIATPYVIASPTPPSPSICPAVVCAIPPQGCTWQKTSACGCGTLVCVSPTKDTPTPTPSSCQKECPTLPSTCHYTLDATCCTPQGDGSCSCPGFVCE